MLRRHALADGATDDAVLRRMDGLRAPVPDRLDAMERHRQTIARVLDRLEPEEGALGDRVAVDRIALACLLGCLDLRFPEDRWRDGRPAFARWRDRFAARPSMRAAPHPA